MTLFWDLLAFIRKKDSESATILLMDLTDYMNIRDLMHMSDYLRSLAGHRSTRTPDQMQEYLDVGASE